MENKTFSHYNIIRKLGSGGMGSVYLAEDQDLPRRVALKFLPPEYTQDKTLKERFFREARATAALEHPNIITIFEAREFEGQPFIAMQYINGPTIGELIDQRGKIDIAESVSIITKVLDTLEDTHKNGISHRDIKPSNVMLKDGKFVRVIDFGIAKAQTDPQLTAVGTAFGTPAYMAPEQFSAQPDANNFLFDIYATGVTFYYMLCGKLPFEGNNPYQIRDDKMSKIPAKPSVHTPSISPELDRVILKSLAKNPDERYQSAKEMEDAILAAMKSDPTMAIQKSDSGEAATVIIDTTGGKKPASKPKGMLIGIAGAIAALAVLFYFTSCPLLGINCAVVEPVITELKAPTLYSPLSGEQLETQNPTFIWGSVPAADGGYALEYASSSSFDQPTQVNNINDTTFSLVANLSNGQYFWRVQSTDTQGRLSEFSQAVAFAINITSEKEPSPPPIITNNGNTEKTSADAVPLAPMVDVVVASIPHLAQIYVDGQLQKDKQTPKTLKIRAGQHTIKVRWEEIGEEMSKNVVIKSGVENRIMFNFQDGTIIVK
ncbi:MAG: serine/threonine protein kinase [candidate division Zixibacteria bacterium]|nr:serine/threonine protein kinase [candidate division Zixibacteria bacterium]